MGIGNNNTPEKEAVSAADSPKTVKETSYTIEQLAPHSVEIFGVSSATFAGATEALDKNAKYTKDHIKKTIEEWKKRKVK